MGGGGGAMSAKGQLEAIYSRYGVQGDGAQPPRHSKLESMWAEVSEASSRPRSTSPGHPLPHPLQKPQATSIPKALVLCHLCPRPYWNQEMPQRSSDPGLAHFLVKDLVVQPLTPLLDSLLQSENSCGNST